MKPQHKKFIAEMKKHGDSTVAYKAAYPSVKASTARVNGSKLLRNATISDIIAKAAAERQKMLGDANDKVQVEAAVNDAQIGIKTRTDRVMGYQSQVEIMEGQLRGDSKFTFKVGNSIKHSHGPDGTFMVPIDVQNDIRAMIRSYKSEISKIENDYPARKTEVTGANGKPIQTENNTIVLYLPENGR